jgi:hypothetical protein
MGAQAPGDFIAIISGGPQEIKLQSNGFIIGSIRKNKNTDHPDGVVEIQSPLFETVVYTVQDDRTSHNGNAPSIDNWSLTQVEVWKDGASSVAVLIFLEKWES